ncbi:MAG: hypothetical protein WCS28_11020 [Thiomicrospira sp.]
MSVLLEALKKAAAEKKALEQKNVESALRPVLSQRNQHKPASHKLSGTESSTFAGVDDAPLALDFNFDLDDQPVKASQPQTNQTPSSAPAEPNDDEPMRLNLKLSDDDAPLPPKPKPKPTVASASTAGASLNLKMAQSGSEVRQSNTNLDLEALDDEFDSLNSLMDSLDEAAQSSAPDVAAKSDLLLDEGADLAPTRQTQPSNSQPVSRSSDAPARITDTAPTPLATEVNTPSPTLVEKPVPTSPDKPDITQLQHILNKATQAPVAKKPRSRWLLWLLLLSLIIGLVLAYSWLKTRALWTSSSTTTALDSAVLAPVLSSDEDLSVEAERLAVAETQINDEGQLDSSANGSIEPKPISEEGAIAEVDKLSESGESVAQICDLPLETATLAISPRASLNTPNSTPTKAPAPASQAQRTAPAAAKTIQVQPKVAPAFNEQAYQAYVEGNFAQAQAWYEQGLAQLANNKTSLLGLAAVAAQYGDWSKSINYYRQVLQHYPQDSDALQGIASIATALESSPQLKQDLEALNRQIPESAVLQFALGNVYAQEGDWFKAQQAYFDSVRLDMNNADYRLNLAISLDRLGQYELALTHYRAAIALQSDDNARFDANTVAQRIQALAAFLGQGH